jgi:peptidoglycan/LPS O-acetylase OafA/YrhL
VALTPPPGHPRFPGLDGVRALAAIAVLAFHASEFSGAERARWWGPLADRLAISVPVFFVVSGFVLYRPFLAGHAGLGPRPSLRRYTKARVLRIVPGYWLAMTLLAIYPGLTGVFTSDWWRYFAFAQIYSLRTEPLGLPPAWTLDVEVVFYAALPLLALLAARRPLERAAAGRPLRHDVASKIHLLGLGGLILASTAFRVWGTRADPGSALTVWPPALIGWFAGGMLLATLSVRRQAAGHPTGEGPGGPRAGTACWVAAALGAIALAAWVPSQLFPPQEPALRLAFENLAYIAIAVLVVAPAVGVIGRGGPPARVLAFRPLQLIGVISYGVYLWHYPIIQTLHDHGLGDSGTLSTLGLAAAALAIASLAATLSYVAVERPAMRLRRRTSGPGRPGVGPDVLDRLNSVPADPEWADDLADLRADVPEDPWDR